MLVVGMIFDHADRRLSVIIESARKLEFAIPFPCAKSDPEIFECRKRGYQGMLMVTQHITLETEPKWPDAQKFLEGAGFHEETN